MSGSLDKHLADMLAINDQLATKKLGEAGAGDMIAGALVRAGLVYIAPELLRELDKNGLGPGQRLQKVR